MIPVLSCTFFYLMILSLWVLGVLLHSYIFCCRILGANGLKITHWPSLWAVLPGPGCVRASGRCPPPPLETCGHRWQKAQRDSQRKEEKQRKAKQEEESGILLQHLKQDRGSHIALCIHNLELLSVLMGEIKMGKRILICKLKFVMQFSLATKPMFTSFHMPEMGNQKSNCSFTWRRWV